jgi:hypothetical protein
VVLTEEDVVLERFGFRFVDMATIPPTTTTTVSLSKRRNRTTVVYKAQFDL